MGGILRKLLCILHLLWLHTAARVPVQSCVHALVLEIMLEMSFSRIS